MCGCPVLRAILLLSIILLFPFIIEPVERFVDYLWDFLMGTKSEDK
jgi:hypothetical protein